MTYIVLNVPLNPNQPTVNVHLKLLSTDFLLCVDDRCLMWYGCSSEGATRVRISQPREERSANSAV